MPVEGFRKHVATDGAVLVVSDGWSACDHDEEMGWMCATLDAELEAERTIKRAELTAFLCLLRIIGPTMAHVDNKSNIDGLWRGDMRRTVPKQRPICRL